MSESGEEELLLLLDEYFKQYTHAIHPYQTTQKYTNIKITANMVIVHIIDNIK